MEDGHRRVLVMARLVHEDENPHDYHAVRVDVNGRTVAYLTPRLGSHLPEVCCGAPCGRYELHRLKPLRSKGRKDDAPMGGVHR
jgi:hypothetical protein